MRLKETLPNIVQNVNIYFFDKKQATQAMNH